MKQKTRYNIRVADRHGITTRVATHPSDVTAFLDLHEKTAARDRFTAQDRNYLADLYENLEPKGLARIRLAERGEILLAGSMEILYGRTATYLHGASSSEGKSNGAVRAALGRDHARKARRQFNLRFLGSESLRQKPRSRIKIRGRESHDSNSVGEGASWIS